MPQYSSLHTHFITEALRLVTYVQLGVLNNVKVPGTGYITPLVIYSLGDGHTYTHTHEHAYQRSAHNQFQETRCVPAFNRRMPSLTTLQ